MSKTHAEAPSSGGAMEHAQERASAGGEQAKSSVGSLNQSKVDAGSTQLGEQLPLVLLLVGALDLEI